MKIDEFIDKTKATKNKDGIWVVKNMKLSSEVALAQQSWERIYNLNVKELNAAKADFKKNKLKDHINYIEKSFPFTQKTIYLEIGCGPAYIGEYLLSKYNCSFIGIDFNYPMLLTLKKYFQSKGIKKYLLIYGDISDLPLKKNSVNYIYGGGVIEHLSNTRSVLGELYRVLNRGGVAFNTVPAFNLWWLTRFWNNVPNIYLLKNIFEYIHLQLLKGVILDKYFGYELSYTIKNLRQLHKITKYKNIKSGPFVFQPSDKKLKNKIFRKLYKNLTSNLLFSPVYYVYGQK